MTVNICSMRLFLSGLNNAPAIWEQKEVGKIKKKKKKHSSHLWSAWCESPLARSPLRVWNSSSLFTTLSQLKFYYRAFVSSVSPRSWIMFLQFSVWAKKPLLLYPVLASHSQMKAACRGKSRFVTDDSKTEERARDVSSPLIHSTDRNRAETNNWIELLAVSEKINWIFTPKWPV